MHRASSRVLATTTSHVARRWRPGLSAPHALGSPLQRTFAAVAITPIDGFAEVASSAETTTRDGSKDKPEEEWQKMVEVNSPRAVYARPVWHPYCQSACHFCTISTIPNDPLARLPFACETGR